MLQIGLVGLPNAGKSTLFNALVKGHAAVAPYPFTTIDPNVGVVAVPDERLDKIAAIAKPSKVTPAAIEFVDIAGLVKKAHQGEGLGNQFLAKIREVDAILFVLRGFTDPEVPHVQGQVDPMQDLSILRVELGLADEQIKEKNPHNPDLARLLLSTKPYLVVVNVDEKTLKDAEPTKMGLPANTVAVSAKLESELADFDDAEKRSYLEPLGISEPVINKIIRQSYRLLDLVTFYTTTSKDLRAWTLKKGSTAPEAAGKIHTDFAKGFIKAEVVHFDDYVKCGGEEGAQAAGRIRTEGKDYQVQDGDIIYFRFSPVH